jgi:hypothetical protein
MHPSDRPTYSLSEIQAQMSCVADMYMRDEVRDDIKLLRISRSQLLGIIRGLKSTDFHKTMPARINPDTWQDAYCVSFSGENLYLKFGKAIDGEEFYVVSCHR